MSDEPFDLTPYVKTFDMEYKTGFNVENLYSRVFRPVEPKVDISFTLSKDTEKLVPRRSVVKMTQRGKYWFDKAFETDVTMERYEVRDDGLVSATFEGINFIDLTNYSYLARFLRWVLRR